MKIKPLLLCAQSGQIQNWWLLGIYDIYHPQVVYVGWKSSKNAENVLFLINFSLIFQRIATYSQLDKSAIISKPINFSQGDIKQVFYTFPFKKYTNWKIMDIIKYEIRWENSKFIDLLVTFDLRSYDIYKIKFDVLNIFSS